jgi:hypothetical protein
MLHSKTTFASNAFRVGGSDTGRDDHRAEIDGPRGKRREYLCIPCRTARTPTFRAQKKRSSQLFGRNRPDGENVVPVGGVRAFVMLLTFDLAKIGDPDPQISPRTIGWAHRFQRDFSSHN